MYLRSRIFTGFDSYQERSKRGGEQLTLASCLLLVNFANTGREVIVLESEICHETAFPLHPHTCQALLDLCIQVMPFQTPSGHMNPTALCSHLCYSTPFHCCLDIQPTRPAASQGQGRCRVRKTLSLEGRPMAPSLRPLTTKPLLDYGRSFPDPKRGSDCRKELNL